MQVFGCFAEFRGIRPLEDLEERSKRLEPYLVDGVALQEVLLEHAICPPAEVHALPGLHSVADRGDRIEGSSYKAICWLALELSMMFAPSV